MVLLVHHQYFPATRWYYLSTGSTISQYPLHQSCTLRPSSPSILYQVSTASTISSQDGITCPPPVPSRRKMVLLVHKQSLPVARWYYLSIGSTVSRYQKYQLCTLSTFLGEDGIICVVEGRIEREVIYDINIL